MSDDQIPSLPGKKRRQMPGVWPGGGGMLKLLRTLSEAVEIMFRCLSYCVVGLRNFRRKVVTHERARMV